MIILGINAYHADASAALLIDGKLVAATEEERFTRTKHWAGFPVLSIAFCLKEAGISLADVDYIAIGRDPKAKLLKKLLFLLSAPMAAFRYAIQRFKNAKQVSSIEEILSTVDNSCDTATLKNKIIQVEHHRAHLASAFYPSPFEEAAVLSIDGAGDFTTTMLGRAKGSSLEVMESIDFPHSLGVFYSAMTQLLGFPYYGDEYKIMGLAPYGNPIYVDALRDVIQIIPDGLFKLNLSYFQSPHKGYVHYSEEHLPLVHTLFNEKMEERFGKLRKKEEALTQYHKDLAASVQRITEEVIFHVLRYVHKKTGLDKVCIAGGVAQNSVANGKITRNTPFKEVYIPSAGHDAGISMGAAYWVHHHQAQQARSETVMQACTGSQFTNEEIIAVCKELNLNYKQVEEATIFDYVATRLAAGKVVGWFNGRAEFGPRALGGRSILADPRRDDAKELLNLKIKRRESFRPFAPSILKEQVSQWFELDEPVPFMEKVFPIRKEKQAQIPAVTHADGSGRLQTVDKTVSERYYKLIDAFYQQTQVPILLNTSFNENEPIVNAPEEAIRCYLRTDMDMLVMQNIILERN
ncbi:MAG: carbamoyltransferase [Bacteroidota bacterium]|nr:carbamoyltransferase [Bacteroidota bacterium]